jgi:DNA-binding transcriptional ArsR family regulator
MIIKDPEVAKLFADKTRRRMLHMLGRNEYSTTDLAKALEKTHSSIIHHLNLLKEADLVQETHTEKVRNMMQTYYRATARRLMISYSLGETMNEEGEDIPWQEGMVQSTLDALESFGYTISDGEEETARKLLNSFFLRDQKAYEETIEQRQKDVSHGRRRGWHTIKLLKTLNLSEDPEYNRVIDELKDILSSIASEGSE